MQNTILLLCHLLLLTACGRYTVDRVKTIQYVYQNQSGQDLTLDVLNVQGQVFKSFSLSPGERITTHTTQYAGPAFFYFDSNDNEIGIEVIARFSKDRCTGYYIDRADALFNESAYQQTATVVEGEKRYSYTYTFTEQDYQAASACKNLEVGE